MRISEEIGIFWSELAAVQKFWLIAGAAVILAALICGWATSLSAWNETRKLEREANHAKADAKDALAAAAKIAREKLEAERRLAELEAKIDGKETDAEKARIETLDARAEYERSLRERRGDDPSTDELCAELAALGYPCQ